MYIYVIETGIYDSTIEAILSHRKLYSLKGLFGEFVDETGVRRDMGSVWDTDTEHPYPAQQRWSDKLGLTTSKVWVSDNREYYFYAGTTELFIAWLIAERGFLKSEYISLNMDVL